MKPTPPPAPEDPIRPHVYDGIAEYDKCMPNWWLKTLYATIVFAIGYWGYYEWFHVGLTGAQEVEVAMAEIQAERLSAVALDDAALWQMSQNATFVSAGRATYDANCVACHLASLKGKSENPAAIGPDLTDTGWVHGGKPVEVLATIEKGVLTKGMPMWGPVLGAKKISEVTAYILSKHQQGEPVVVEVAKAASQ